MNFDNHLFRASQIGTLMTDGKSKSDPLSETTKSELLKVYAQSLGRYEDINNKYIEKGHKREKDAIDEWRRLRKHIVFKNEERLSNEFVTGLPDLLIKLSDSEVINVPDIKCSWSLNTYLQSMAKPLCKEYYWQGQVYMWLTGSPIATFVFSLQNCTLQQLVDEKYRLARRMDLIDEQSNPEYIAKCKDIERNMIFDLDKFLNEYPDADLVIKPSEWKWTIPVERRFHEKVIQYNPQDIEQLKTRIPLWRQYLSEIHQKFCGEWPM